MSFKYNDYEYSTGDHMEATSSEYYSSLGGRAIRTCPRSLCISNINGLFTLLDSKYGSRKHNLSICYENSFCRLSFRIVQVPSHFDL